MVVQESYQWLVIVGSMSAFLFGWGTGSNDVANAFGTSVGSGALTLKQAILIASIFEFTGAMVLGRVSTSVIAGGIADIKVFQNATDCNGALVYGYGMMWTLILGGLWQGYASYVGLNVSATHTIIAGIIGFSLQFRNNGVIWISSTPTSVGLPYGGIVPIVVTWFFAPCAVGFCSSTLFIIIRNTILRFPNSYNRAYYVLPILVFFTFWINIYFVFTKGAKKTFSEQNNGKGDDWSDSKAAWISAAISGGVSIISIGCIPLIHKWVIRWAEYENKILNQKEMRKMKNIKNIDNVENNELNNKIALTIKEKNKLSHDSNIKQDIFINDVENNTEKDGIVVESYDEIPDANESRIENTDEKDEPQKDNIADSQSTVNTITDIETLDIPPDIFKNPIQSIKLQWINIMNFDYGMDYFENLDEKVENIHKRAEQFDPMTEKLFGFLQIFSATCVMFAHGAGEVGYMAGPLATIYDVYSTGKLQKTINAPIWTVVISALSLVCGLATYGRNVTKAVGKDLAKITPSRGFCAEISTAMVIMVAAQYGLPTSSSQAITGGIIGIGIVEGLEGVNWMFFFQQFSSWILTMLVMGLGTALMFAQGHNAP